MGELWDRSYSPRILAEGIEHRPFHGANGMGIPDSEVRQKGLILGLCRGHGNRRMFVKTKYSPPQEPTIKLHKTLSFFYVFWH